MEIGQYPASSCSKEHQKIYQEWFALADAGPFPAPLFCFPSIPNLQFHCCAPGCGLLIDGVADGDGRITGPDAIKFFGMSKLSRPDLKQVLALATSPHPLSCFVLLAELLVYICAIFV
jgi:EH domain-containing protein 1